MLLSFIFFIFMCSISYSSTNNVNLFEDVLLINKSKNYQAVVEIQAGDNLKREILKRNGKLRIEKIENDIPRVIQYISYPFNYGILPQTISTTEDGGDGDALDVLILGNKIKRGAVVEIKILGSINFIDSGENDFKIIAIKNENSIFNDINSLNDLSLKYPGVIEIIKIWFNNYKGKNRVYFDKLINIKDTFELINKANKSFIYYKNNTIETQ